MCPANKSGKGTGADMKTLFFAAAYLLSASIFADFTIVLPERPSGQETVAASELSEHLGKSTGQKITTTNEGKSVSGPAIYLGNTIFARKHKIDPASMDGEEWLVKSFGDSLAITGGEIRGTLYGVMEFLENELGIVFADETFTYIPARKNYKWKPALELRGRPAFRDRGIYSYFTGNDLPRHKFMLRNRLNMFPDEGLSKIHESWRYAPVFGSPRFCHTFHSYTKDLGPEDDDCFSLSASGKRIRSTSPSGPGQICFTNLKTRAIFLKKLLKNIETDRAKQKPGTQPPRIYVIEANDNPSKCECVNCLRAAKKYGAYSGVMLEFLNFLARETAKKHSDVLLLANAYNFTLKPPVGIKPEKNAMIRIAQLGTEWGSSKNRDTMRPLTHKSNSARLKDIADWNKIAALAIWDYWILYAGKSALPSLNTYAIAENLKTYSRFNIVSVFAECESAHTASFHPLRLWLGARFMNNPKLSVRDEITRFIRAYYGPSAGFMLQYHDFLLKRMTDADGSAGLMPVSRRSELDDSFFATADSFLDKAEKAANGDAALLGRIRRERVSVDRGSIERRDFTGNLKEPAALKKTLERFKRNFTASCNLNVMSKTAVGKNLKWLEDFLEGLRVRAPLPPDFKNMDIVADFTWPKISRLSRSVRLTDDKDAAGGKCLSIAGREKPDAAINFGVYDPESKRQIKNIRIGREKIEDGKYRFYRTGAFSLTERCFLWSHWSWNIQCDLSPYYDRSGLNNNVEAFISVKISGTGDKASFSVDRAILTRVMRVSE